MIFCNANYTTYIVPFVVNMSQTGYNHIKKWRLQKDIMKKANILNLIKYHVENNDYAFRSEANEIARDFDSAGDYKLAEYIMGLLATNNVLIPQQMTYSGKLLSKMEIQNIPSLFLNTDIAEEITGIVNAVKHNIGINKFLFEGKPGTGKTESVKQLANMLKRDLYVVDFESLIDSRLGQTNKNISEVFKEINHIPAPERFIVLFDEIDVIALDRINSHDVREMGRVTSIVLRELDKLNDQVVLVATTNLFSNFDRALLRRFDAIINFDKYSNADLQDIGIKILSGLQPSFKNTAKDARLFKKIIASSGQKLSPGELKNIIRMSLAFSSLEDPYDYLRKFGSKILDYPLTDLKALSNDEFTLREIEILSKKSKSQVQRELKGETKK